LHPYEQKGEAYKCFPVEHNDRAPNGEVADSSSISGTQAWKRDARRSQFRALEAKILLLKFDWAPLNRLQHDGTPESRNSFRLFTRRWKAVSCSRAFCGSWRAAVGLQNTSFAISPQAHREA